MPRRHAAILIGGASSLLLLACAPDPEGEFAIVCTDDLGCPAGSRCVQGIFCEPTGDVDAGGFSFPPTPGSAGGGTTGGGGGDQLDGGDLDGGRLDGGRLDGGVVIFDGGEAPGGCFGGLQLCDVICTDVQSDPLNCGECGIVCTGGDACRLGVCCNATETVCGDRCTDLDQDPRNCGACGVDCGVGECFLGTCQASIGGPSLPTP